ncbi:MAG: pilus assembly protein TadB [Lachnospiraceae bacterium]|nr:pilus assembly protein TadB [Lachnospiraceae bacterium]
MMLKNLKRQDLQSDIYFPISLKEKLFLYIKSIVVILLINYCFYQSFWAFIPLSAIGLIFYGRERKELIYKKKGEARQQFKELLSLTVTGQKAGYSVENAFLKNYEDMMNLYGEKSSICKMLTELKIGLGNNLRAADLWRAIGKASDIEEIKEFAEVFEIAKESGGNMTVIMEKTAETIGNKAETQNEIELLLSARKLEQKIMNVMPFFLMVYVTLTTPGYFKGLYHSMEGTVIMTFCLLLYLSAYIIGIKITDIEV